MHSLGFNLPVVQVFDDNQYDETKYSDMDIARLTLSLLICADQFQKAQIPLDGSESIIIPYMYNE